MQGRLTTKSDPGETFGTAIVYMIIMSILIPFFALTSSGPAMLALGVIHNDITPHCPALGFWAIFLILWGGPTLIGLAARPFTGKAPQ